MSQQQAYKHNLLALTGLSIYEYAYMPACTAHTYEYCLVDAHSDSIRTRALIVYSSGGSSNSSMPTRVFYTPSGTNTFPLG